MNIPQANFSETESDLETIGPVLEAESLHYDLCLGVFWLELDDTSRQHKKELRDET